MSSGTTGCGVRGMRYNGTAIIVIAAGTSASARALMGVLAATSSSGSTSAIVHKASGGATEVTGSIGAAPEDNTPTN